jgi:hypothetical protein
MVTHSASNQGMSEISPFRVPYDFYATPPEGTLALLSVETFDGPIWEPACGDGAIARVLARAGYCVQATDLVDRGYGEAGVNFLAQTTSRAKHIVTNPPYGRGLADGFIRHALRLTSQTGGSVAMLLDLASLAHPKRHAFYVATPPAAVYVLDQLLCLPNGRQPRYEAENRYCWLMWKPGHSGRPALWWLSTARFRQAEPSRR